MDLKKFLPGKESDTREYFWALVIEPGWVQAGVWRIQDKEAQVIFSSPEAAWELDSELVAAADTALSSAIQNFPEDQNEPSKTVFGVVSSWVTGGQIKEEYLDTIKKLCFELSLKPVGFVVVPEAIAHLTKAEEGSPLNAVVIGVYKDVAEVSVFKLGNLLGTTTVARSVSIADDVVEGLTRFAKGETLPSRFILYDGKDGELEDYRQNLLSVNWNDNEGVKFLHTPKVEIITGGRKIQAISLAGASEMADVTSVAPLEEKVGEPEVSANAEQREVREIEKPRLEDVGFALEKDVAAEGSETSVGNDFQEREEISPEEALKDTTLQNVSRVSSKDAFNKKRNSNSIVTAVSGRIALLFSGIKNRTRGMKNSRVNVPVDYATRSAKKNFRINKAFIFGGIFFVLLLAGGFGFWWFYPKAVVTVYISPQKLEEHVEISVDPKALNPDSSARVLPGTELKASVTGEKTKSTTGTKTVGDKAKGEVTLYRVGTELTLPTGTLITGPDNLRFSLGDAIKVASGSASTPGTTKASVVAESIGAQYNLATGSSFKVGNYSTSDIEAKNESGFSGGSSREISAVSSEDQKELLRDLTDELTENAKDELMTQLTVDQFFIEDSLTATASSKEYSSKVGDEAETLKLSMKLEAIAFAVKKPELINLAQEALKGKVPEGFVLRDEQIDVEFEYKDKREGKYIFEAVVFANLLPQINPDDVARKISGKHKTLADTFLSEEISGFSRSTIVITPNLPGRLNTLPRVLKNIEVEISADR